jgi:hypothetical protein
MDLVICPKLQAEEAETFKKRLKYYKFVFHVEPYKAMQHISISTAYSVLQKKVVPMSPVRVFTGIPNSIVHSMLSILTAIVWLRIIKASVMLPPEYPMMPF